METPTSTHLLEELHACLELTRRVRAVVEGGRLDELESVVEERGRRLTHVAEELERRPEPDPRIAEELDRLEAENRALLEWMTTEKQATLGALRSLQGEDGDPYREKMVGSTVLDRTI